MKQPVNIALGSTNQIKVQALHEVLEDCPVLGESEIFVVDVFSDISEQPLSLNETIRGAKNRARHAFEICERCAYSFGIECGLMEVTESRTGFMGLSVCCIYDGHEFYLGQSCGVELPQHIIDLVIHRGLSLEKACHESGLMSDSRSSADGVIGVLTKGRINRKDTVKSAILAALTQIENMELYAPILEALSLNP